MKTPVTFLTYNQYPLWQRFMPRHKEIQERKGNDLFSIQVFSKEQRFDIPDLGRTFDRWAAVEVTANAPVPEGMEVLNCEGGLYASFRYVGTAENFFPFAQYIFGKWIPSSKYEVDLRPHLAVMGEKYSNTDPSSEEDILVPIKTRNQI